MRTTLTLAFACGARRRYVIHTLEPHHTLAGIALQYRCTVEQLLRINGFGSHLDLHTKAQIRIPVSRYGALYADPSAFKSEDAGSATHTTAAPRLPTSQDRVAGGLIEGADDPDEATSNDTHAYLSSFDAQMEGAIAAMDATLAAQVRDEPLPPAAALAPQAEGLMAFYPKDWRVLFGCVAAPRAAGRPNLGGGGGSHNKRFAAAERLPTAMCASLTRT